MSVFSAVRSAVRDAFKSQNHPALAVLTKFGTDAHVWLPGIGYLNGLEAGNYIDSAGTQAGLVDNPVGFVLDATASTKIPAVSDFGVPSTYDNTLTAVTSSGFSANAGTTNTRAYINLQTVIGKTYRIQANLSSFSGNITLFARDNLNGVGTILATSVAFTSGQSAFIEFIATTTASSFMFTSGSLAVSYSVSNIKIYEAINATQGTTANKPILRRGAVNLLLQSQTFSNASWGKSAINVASGATAPNASITAFTASEDTTTGTHDLTQSLTISAGQIQTYSIYVKASGRDLVRIMLTWNSVVDRVHADFDLANGTVGSAVTTGAGVSAETPKITAVGNGWYRCVISGSCPTGTTLICYARGMQSAGVVSYTGSGASAYQIWGAQLELGSTASEYIPTTTAAASSSSGDYYWQFDGSTDFLALSSVPFVATDDLCVVFAARTNEQAATGRAAFGFSGATGQRMAMIYNESGYWYFRFVDDTTTIFSIQATTQLAAGSLRVVSGRKSSNVRVLRLNAVQESSNSTPVGTTTITGGSIGSRDSASASAGYLGSIYPVIAIKGTVSDADLLVLERWVGSLSGVSI